MTPKPTTIIFPEGMAMPGARYYDSDLGIWRSVDPLNQYQSPYTCCGNNPIRIIDKDGLYGEDVHLDLTYFMAIVVMGVSSTIASEIANANQDVNDNFFTSSLNPLMFDNSLHFTSPLSLKVCDNLYNNAAKQSNELFGASLHTFMDINFAHYSYFAVNSDGVYGHLNHMDVDKVALNGKLKLTSIEMIRAVYELMKQRNGGKTKISFNSLMDQLNKYINEHGIFQCIDNTVKGKSSTDDDQKNQNTYGPGMQYKTGMIDIHPEIK